MNHTTRVTPTFASNSVADLLDARDAYHIHLMHKSNVVATAVGRYRIQLDDYYAQHPPDADDRRTHPKPNTPRTLFNSVVRPWSWPCVLVFVDLWQDRSAFVDEPDQMIPRTLYLPDGRAIPTCVVLVERDLTSPGPIAALPMPVDAIGPGCAVLSSVQGKEHVGTIAAIVSDGATYYALTNRHVAGPAGQPAFTDFRGVRERIGVSATLSLAKIPFSSAYSGWRGTDTVVNVDAGLIEIDDLDAWTPNVIGLGAPGEPLDLRPDSFTLDLIDAHVSAYGAASQRLDGTIAAFFYRYRAVGGREYLADFLIAPASSTQTHPGDSGTMWHFVDSLTGNVRPFAMQWGGHAFFSEGQRRDARGFALASTLSTICRELDLDVVRAWDQQLPEYWGDVGHYTIAAKACEIVTTPDLRTLMRNNLTNISYPDAKITPKTFVGLSKAAFIPLADVPDKVWKMHGSGARGAPEHPNHFADMDKPDPRTGQTTLLDATSDGHGGTEKAKVRIATFAAYYTDVADASRGCLPFRVWQLFDIMLAARNEAEFVCAAGVLAHYVGDACQPLHISYLFNGIPQPDGSVQGAGVHSTYESKMVGVYAAEILAAINTQFGIEPAGQGRGMPSSIATGEDAAAATVQLMRETFSVIAPKAIDDAYIADPSVTSFWRKFGPDTIRVIAMGVQTLAQIYDGAWNNNPFALTTVTVAPEKLSALYLDPQWAPSHTLDQLATIIPAAR